MLREVAHRLGLAAGSGTMIGRYGPDEFLVIGPPVATEAVAEVVSKMRSGLRTVDIRLGDGEALPITSSAGLASFPSAADGVTDLLVAAAQAAQEAKASGGDAVRTSGVIGSQPTQSGTYTALQGLVLAIDTKDRYTKRHSEDVARYALFLGHEFHAPPEVDGAAPPGRAASRRGQDWHS